jgi:cobalt-zinc-cadmium resistance protein CzcA
VDTRIRDLNASSHQILPGTRIDLYQDRSDGGERSLWVQGTLPQNASPEQAEGPARKVRQLLRSMPEVERVVSQVGGSEEGTDPQWMEQVQFFVQLKTPGNADAPGREPTRTRAELLGEIRRLLVDQVPGAAWLLTEKDPEELALAFPGVHAEHLLKIVGPDIAELQRLAGPVRAALGTVPGVEDIVPYASSGARRLELRIDPDKCARWGVSRADVSMVLQTALGGKIISQMVEGDQRFDIMLRWPHAAKTSVLDFPVDISNSQLVPANGPDAKPPPTGNPATNTPRPRLGDLVSSTGQGGEPGSDDDFVRLGAAPIYREQGTRLLPVQFSMRGRSLADVRAEATERVGPLVKAPYRIEWGD